MWISFFFSLGCGIGYGYLHRIPIRSIPDTKPMNSYIVSSLLSPSYRFLKFFRHSFSQWNFGLQANQANVVTTQLTNSTIPQVSNMGTTSVTIPTGFTIPSGLATIPQTPNLSSEAPVAPPNPISSVSVDIPGSTNSTAHLFSSPQTVLPSKIISLSKQNKKSKLKASMIFVSFFLDTEHTTYQSTPNIPGMPQTSPLPPLPFDITAMSSVSTLGSPTQIYNPIPTATVASTLPYGVAPQSQIVTPISLPGMPPITVSAAMPQNPSFYQPVRQPEAPTSHSVPPPTTMAPTQ